MQFSWEGSPAEFYLTWKSCPSMCLGLRMKREIRWLFQQDCHSCGVYSLVAKREALYVNAQNRDERLQSCAYPGVNLVAV